MNKLNHCFYFLLITLATLSLRPMNDVSQKLQEEVENRIAQNLKGKELIAPLDKFGRGILSELAINNQTNLISTIFNHDPSIDINNISILKSHPLEFAILNKHKWVTKLLLINNANANIRDDHELTPLHKIASECTPDEVLDNDIIESLIISGANIAAKTHPNIGFCQTGFGWRLGEYTAMDILKYYRRDGTAQYIQQTAQQRDELFKAVKNGEAISFNNTNKISRCHVRDTHGNNLLYHALQHRNHSVAKTLIVLWPHLITQQNLKGISAFETFPAQMIDMPNHSQP